MDQYNQIQLKQHFEWGVKWKMLKLYCTCISQFSYGFTVSETIVRAAVDHFVYKNMTKQVRARERGLSTKREKSKTCVDIKWLAEVKNGTTSKNTSYNN